MAARLHITPGWASVLVRLGRVIAGACALTFLLALAGEAVNQYPPGGGVMTRTLLFASGVVTALAVVVSFWRPRHGGLILVAERLASSHLAPVGAFLPGNTDMGIAFGMVTRLLPGLLTVVVGMAQRGDAQA